MNNSLNALLNDPSVTAYNVRVDNNGVNGTITLRDDNNRDTTYDLFSAPLCAIDSANSNSTIISAPGKSTLKTITVEDVEVIAPNKVVRVTFKDGLYEKAVCHKDDVFDLETAIAICIVKHMFGGTANYNKMIKNIIRNYSKKLKEEEENKEIAEKKLAKSKRNYEKRQHKRAKKDAAARELRIREQAEAIVLANELMNERIKNNTLTDEFMDEQGDK